MRQFSIQKIKILSGSLLIISAMTISACNSGSVTDSSNSVSSGVLNSLASESSGWSYVGQAGFSLDSASFQSMDIAPDGTLYLSYTGKWKSTVMKFNGSAWEVVGESGFGYGNQTIAIAPMDSPQSGTPYVAYGFGDASVMKFDGKSWGYVGEPMFAYDLYEGCAPTIAISPNTGTPYIAYSSGYGGVKVMKFNNEDWVNVGDVFGFDYSDGILPAIIENLVITKDGTPYVAFNALQDSMSKGTLSTPVVMKFDGYNWSLVGAKLETSQKLGMSMVLDSSNTPYVAYIMPRHTKPFPSSATAPEGLAIKKLNTTTNTWEGVGMYKSIWNDLEYPIVTNAEHPSLAMAFDGSLYVSYTDTANGNKVTVMKFNGEVWEKLGAEDFSAGSTEMQKIKISNNNVPYVSFIDGSQNNKTTVMKFAH